MNTANPLMNGTLVFTKFFFSISLSFSRVQYVLANEQHKQRVNTLSVHISVSIALLSMKYETDHSYSYNVSQL